MLLELVPESPCIIHTIHGYRYPQKEDSERSRFSVGAGPEEHKDEGELDEEVEDWRLERRQNEG